MQITTAAAQARRAAEAQVTRSVTDDDAVARKPTAVGLASLGVRSQAHLTEQEKSFLPISEKAVLDAIEAANKSVSGGNTRFEFSIHTKTKQIMVKVIDEESNEIVREIPPEKILDMIAGIWDVVGLFVDQRR